MRLTKVQQILKAFSDDTRLRIINLLNVRELNVTQICGILGKNQSNVSKHLAGLRLLGIVADRRCGINVYYYLPEPGNEIQKEILKVFTDGLKELEIIKRDLSRLKKLKK